MAFCTKCGADRTGGVFCTSCGNAQPATVSSSPFQPAPASNGHRLRNVLIVAGVAVLFFTGLGIAGTVYAVRKAKGKAQELVRSAELSSALAAEVPAEERSPVLAPTPVVENGAADPGNALPASFPAWQSSTSSPASTAPPRNGMLVVTAIADDDGDYESMKQIRSIDAGGITLSYHGEKPKDGQQEINGSRLVLAEDLQKAHDYAELFGANQPHSFPGTTAITASKEVFLELSQKGSSEFSFQPDGLKGALGSMVSALSAFGGLGGTDPGTNEALDKVSKDRCTLKREGAGLFAVPVLLDDQPTTLPAIHAECSTDDGPAEFYILNQPEYPLMLAWKLGSGSQLQVTKISYPALTKAEARPASTHIEEQLQENKKVDIYGIYFDFGSDQLKPESTPVLNEIAAVLAAHPDWKLNVSGHTDNIGGDDVNLDLSRRRSAAVKATLVANYRIAPSRLMTDGFGASRPVDTNATLAGRARNRRVELVRE